MLMTEFLLLWWPKFRMYILAHAFSSIWLWSRHKDFMFRTSRIVKVFFRNLLFLFFSWRLSSLFNGANFPSSLVLQILSLYPVPGWFHTSLMHCKKIVTFLKLRFYFVKSGFFWFLSNEYLMHFQMHSNPSERIGLFQWNFLTVLLLWLQQL